MPFSDLPKMECKYIMRRKVGDGGRMGGIWMRISDEMDRERGIGREGKKGRLRQDTVY